MTRIKLLSLLAITLAIAGLGALAMWLSVPAPVRALDPAPDAPSGLTAGGEPILPLPPPPTVPAAKVQLGEALFFDVRLSADDTISCASCHDLKQGGGDGQRFSVGVKRAVGSVNAPTVFNAALNFAQFWDGRAATLEEQAAGPVHNPVEMASSWPQVLAKLKRDGNYRRLFGYVYADGITAANTVDAIAAFERTLVTVDAPFDRYLRGDGKAMDELALAGYRRFKDYGCASCHQGVNVGGNMYQRFGVMADYFAERRITKSDLGRYNVTGLDEDRHVFKVPGLRNVALTAPYFHDGTAASLDEAVAVMGRFQLGRELTAEDVRAISAFLHTLTGRWQGQYLQ